MSSSLRRFLVISLACLAFTAPAMPVRAQIPVTDAANLAANTTSAVSNVKQSVISEILNGIAWTVAKVTVQSITRSVVNWINSGFEGSPAFVTDLKANLSYLGDAIADDFFMFLDSEVEATTGFNLRTPFQDQINQQLREEYFRTTASWGLDYTLNRYSRDPRAFIDEGRFVEGGFDALFAASQNPGNNPMMRYAYARNELFRRISAARQERLANLNWGRGFLPWRGPCRAQAATNVVPPPNASGMSHEGAHSGAQNLSPAERCPFNSIRTPGSIIEDQLAHTLGSGVRQLELADSINEIVGALVGQLVNQVLGGGGLAGASRPAAGGGPSFADRVGSPAQVEGVTASLADGILQTIATDRRNLSRFVEQWTSIRTAALSAQARCGAGALSGDAIARADAAIAKGNRALSELTAVEQRVRSAQASTAPNLTTLITDAVSAYQSYMRSPSVPSPEEIAEAAQQSAPDTSGSVSPSGSASQNQQQGVPSLLVQLTRLAASCTVR